ncbi:MAG: CAP domain-containing protein [Spirochaetes bacterium]|nr:CAP domain-containing protein [Spirochaetota bacterium]
MTSLSKRAAPRAACLVLFALALSPAFAEREPAKVFAADGFARVTSSSIEPIRSADLAAAGLSADALSGMPLLVFVYGASNPSTIDALGALDGAGRPGVGIIALAGTGKPGTELGTKYRNVIVAPVPSGLTRRLGNNRGPAWFVADAKGAVVLVKIGALDHRKVSFGELLGAVASAYPVSPVAAAAPGKPEPASAPPPSVAPIPPAGPSSPLAPLPAGPTAPTVPTPGAPASSADGSREGVLPNKGVADLSFMSQVEIEVIAELNFARMNPQAYVERLREYRSFIRNGVYEKPGEIGISLNEGVKAVDEAIKVLSSQKPLSPFSASRGLWQACRDHVKDQGPKGTVGHDGSDRSSPFDRMQRYGSWKSTAGENIAYGGKAARDIVIQLIVDDGVPSRGHRANIFNAQFLVVGVGVGQHKVYGAMSVMDFAGGYAEKP